MKRKGKEIPMATAKVIVPAKCLICGAEWRGGHQLPNKPMKVGLRVFYDCGASLSIKKESMIEDGCYILLLKNCQGNQSTETKS